MQRRSVGDRLSSLCLIKLGALIQPHLPRRRQRHNGRRTFVKHRAGPLANDLGIKILFGGRSHAVDHTWAVPSATNKRVQRER